MLGRESRRISDRIGAEEEAEVSFRGKRHRGKTVDVSEEGIGLRFPEPVSLSRDDRFRVLVTTPHYRAALDAVCAYSREEQSRRSWFAAAVVVPETEEDRRNWLQIIHDREHSLPREIDPWMTIYDEVRRNIEMRWGKGKET